MRLAEGFVDIDPRMANLSAGLKRAEDQTKSAIGNMQKAVDKYSASIKKIGAIVVGAGAAIGGTFAALVAGATKAGDEFDKMSKRTGIAVETLSELSFAAKISGTNIQTIEGGVRFLARTMDDFSRGVGESKDKFEKFGISVLDNNGELKSTVDVMKDVSDVIAGLSSETEQVAVATDLFGSRYGTQLLPMLKEGSAGIKRLTDRANELGVVMSAEAAKSAAEFNDRMTEMKESLKFAAIELGNNLIPLLKPLVERVTEIIGKATNWVKENEDLARSIGKIGLVLTPMLVAGGTLAIAAPTILKIAVAVKTLNLALIPVGKAAAPLIAVIAAIKAWRELHPDEADIGKLPSKEEINEWQRAVGAAMDSLNEKGKGPVFELGKLTPEEAAWMEKYITDIKKTGQTVSEVDLSFLIPDDSELNRIETLTSAYQDIFKELDAIQTRERDPFNLKAMIEATERYKKELSEAPGGVLDVPVEYKGLWLDAYQSQVQASRETTDIVRKHTHLLTREALELNNALREQDIKNKEKMQKKWDLVSKDFTKTLIAMDKAFEETNESIEAKISDMERMFENMAHGIEHAFSNLFYGIMTDMDNFSDIWHNFLNDLKRSFSRAIADMAAEKFMDKVFGNGAAGVGGNGKGLVTSILEKIGILKAGQMMASAEGGGTAGTWGSMYPEGGAMLAGGTSTYGLGPAALVIAGTLLGAKAVEAGFHQSGWYKEHVRKMESQTLSDYWTQQAAKRRSATSAPYVPDLSGASQETYNEYFRWLRTQRGIDRYAEGGLFFRPTIGMIAEKGPEAVVPLNRISPVGGVNIESLTVNLSFPNANPWDIPQSEFDSRLGGKILNTVKGLAKGGQLNEVIL